LQLIFNTKLLKRDLEQNKPHSFHYRSHIPSFIAHTHQTGSGTNSIEKSRSAWNPIQTIWDTPQNYFLN